MSDTILTRERILDTAEEVLRRYGPAKATVLDVSRSLGVSHGSVYRHFPSKTALRDAVAERWLARVSAPLAVIAAEDGPAPERLHRWLLRLSAEKRRMAREDPELFDTFHTIATEAREVVAEHLRLLAAQITQIIESGISRDEFAPTDATVAGRAVLQATARFHHPVHAMEWSESGIDADFDAVIALILCGLRAGPSGR
ncbi:TetR family transcriptional regulator [Agromyces bauzanensis]|uniref:TetR family transcriptional regulator n=1 Tax=Agromyces bauzanensis TaxID=1308924 RepID=A0A917UWV8_9MICO|nr:TetR family transcriptional regulator [Agromyces bauzanensis]GGJ90908.1 TetR family transcriptional regulator [Agromyces bauzanensis]